MKAWCLTRPTALYVDAFFRLINSLAVGMAVARPYDFEIDFRNQLHDFL